MNPGDSDAAGGCVDCERLKEGSRSRTGPHQYQVLSGRFGVVSSHEYRCLVCKTVLVCDTGDSGEVWNNWTPDIKAASAGAGSPTPKMPNLAAN